MIRFSRILKESAIDLDMKATDVEGAVDALISRLSGDPRIVDPGILAEGLKARVPPAVEQNGISICIAHCRTESVRELVMAAGRMRVVGDSPGAGTPVRLVFLAGIPAAFSTEYLRAVGAIARICREPASLEHLLSTRTPAGFVEVLEEGLNPD